MALDLEGLTPLDTTGLRPAARDPAPSPDRGDLDTSGLTVLDVSGLKPAGDDPLQPLRSHAERNIEQGTAVENPDGSTSTVRSGSVRDERLNNGRPTLIPFVWDGKVVDPDEAIARAVESGVEWPAFESDEAATQASKRLSESIIPQRKSGGLLSRIGGGFSEGFGMAAQGVELTGEVLSGADPETLSESIAAHNRRESGVSPEMQGIQRRMQAVAEPYNVDAPEAEPPTGWRAFARMMPGGQAAAMLSDAAWGKGTQLHKLKGVFHTIAAGAKEFVNDPAAFAEFTAQNLGTSAVPIGAMVAGGLVGSALPGPGSAAGAIGGGFVGSSALEFGLWIQEAVTARVIEAGGDPTNAQSIATILQDDAVRAEILKEAATKGLTHAAVGAVLDRLSVGLLRYKPRTRTGLVAQKGAAGTLQVASEGAEEAISQQAATGDYDVADVALETIGGIGSGTSQTIILDMAKRGANAATGRRQGPGPGPEGAPDIPEGAVPGATLLGEEVDTGPAGVRETVRANAEPLSDEDVESPIPTNIIHEGKQAVQDAEGARAASEVLEAAGLPPVDTRVTLTTRDGGTIGGTVIDAFDTGDSQGAKIRLDNGKVVAETFEQLQGRVQPEAAPGIEAGADPAAATDQGRQAFEGGQERQAPAGLPPEAQKAWYDGWDRANIGQGVQPMAEREQSAGQRFIDSAMEQFGLTSEQAARAFEGLRQEGLVEIDPVEGQFRLTDGRFWDRDVLLQAAGQDAAPTLDTSGLKPVAADDDRSKKQKERIQKMRQVDPDKDDIITAIRKLGGIDTDRESDWRGRLSHLNARDRRPGLPGIERPGAGLTLDELTEQLAELGYVNAARDAYDQSELADLLSRSEGGDQVFGQASAAQAIDKEAQERDEMEIERAKAEEEALQAKVEETGGTPEPPDESELEPIGGGFALEEEEYDPGWLAEARTIRELHHEAKQYDPDAADDILARGLDDAVVAIRLREVIENGRREQAEQQETESPSSVGPGARPSDPRPDPGTRAEAPPEETPPVVDDERETSLADEQDFGGIELVEQRIVQETGETVTVRYSAQRAWDQTRKRRDVTRQLLECVRGG